MYSRRIWVSVIFWTYITGKLLKHLALNCIISGNGGRPSMESPSMTPTIIWVSGWVTGCCWIFS